MSKIQKYLNSKGSYLILFVCLIGMLSILAIDVPNKNELFRDIKRNSQNRYIETIMNANYNLIFYQDNCPYCKVAEEDLMNSINNSKYPCYFINTKSKEGSLLKEHYHVKVASTILAIRDGVIKKRLLYAYRKESNGQYQSKTKEIQNFF